MIALPSWTVSTQTVSIIHSLVFKLFYVTAMKNNLAMQGAFLVLTLK